MPALWNINNLNNPSSKKIANKLSFQVGETFKGRIVSLERDGSYNIKLIDGWQFSAEIEGNTENLPKDMIKFQVEGFKEGKILLKLIPSENESGIKAPVFNNYLMELGVSGEDLDLVLMLLRHNITLSKENINLAKSVIDARNKAENDEGYIDGFIEKYINIKNPALAPESKAYLRELLQSAFKMLPKVSTEDLLTFMENEIMITPENIDSFNRIFKEWGSIYNTIKKASLELSEDIEEDYFTADNHRINLKNKEISEGEKEGKVTLKDRKEESSPQITASKAYNSKQSISIITKIKDILSQEEIDAAEKESNRPVKEETGFIENERSSNNYKEEKIQFKTVNKDSDFYKQINEYKEEIKSFIKALSAGNMELSSTEEIKKELSNFIYNKTGIAYEITAEELESIIELLDRETQNIGNKDLYSRNSNKSSKEEVKLQMEEKSLEIKSIINSLIRITSGKNSELTDKIYAVMKDRINDFKLLNTISNEYYYLDLPITLNKREYPLKLIIKDNRKEGKKIDSKNVKMIISVDTSNLDVVDAYIHAVNSNMDIELKSNEKWVGILEKEKVKLLNSLVTLGYNTDISVTKKEEDATISSSREFFNDSMLTIVDVLV